MSLELIKIEKGGGRELDSPQSHFYMLKKIINYLEKNKILNYSLIILNLGLMFYFSSLNGDSIGFVSIWPSIIYHFFIFSLFGFLFYISLSKKIPNNKRILLSLSTGLVIAILDEIHQIFVPLRNPSLLDIGIDFLGINLGVIFNLNLRN